MKVLIVVLALLATGCGTIFNGTRQNIRLTSSPDKAAVATVPATVDYTTPTTISLQRKREHTLTISMPGYTSQTVLLENHIRGGIVVLDILAGLVGIIIDAATGAWYGLSPSLVSVTLTKASAEVIGPETVTVTVTIDQKKATATTNVMGVQLRAQ